LAVTVAFIAAFTLNDQMMGYVAKNTWLMNVSMISTLGCVLVMSFSTTARRTTPLNMILLGFFTVCQAFLVGFITQFYAVDEVIYAVGLTAAIVFGLSVYANSTKEDFTM